MKHHDIQNPSLAAALLCVATALPAGAATEVYTSRAAFEARVAEINDLGVATLPLELQNFDETIPGSNMSERSGPGNYTYRDVPLAVAAGGFGVHSSAGALGYQANGGGDAPLVIETSVPVNALGFDVVGFGSEDIDPFFVCFPPDYALEFTGGDLARFVIDTEVANGNGDAGNSQFFGIVDVDSPFSQVELNNTGFYDASECGFAGTIDTGDTIRVEDLSFGAASFTQICGDVDGNRFVDDDDVSALRNSLARQQPLSAPGNCSVVNGADSCDIADAVVIARSAAMAGSLPGIADVCRSNNPPPADIASALVGYWPFDEPDGVAVNHSPRGLRVNALPSGDAQRAPGKIGSGALSLPDVAVDGFVAVVDSAGRSTLTASSELTIATWLRPTGPGASAVLGGAIVSNAGQYEVFRRPDGTLRWQKVWGSQPADIDFGLSNFAVPEDEWTHIAITFDDVEAKLYVNGVLDQSWLITAGIGDNVPDNDALRIGSSASAVGRHFEGDIDETAIWLRALTDSDVDFLYDEGFGRRAHELRVLAANFDVDGSDIWRVTETAAPGFAVATDTVNPGDVRPTYNGAGLYAEAGILMPTIRETRDGPSSNLPLATAYAQAASGEQWVSITDMTGADGNEVNARVSIAFFPFAKGWIGGRVLSNGTLNFGNGVTQANVTRVGTGAYNVTIPGVTDARAQGMLYAVDANNSGDNLVMTTPIGGLWRVNSYDNDGNFGAGQDVAWNFVYIPYDAPNLVAGEIDQQQAEINGTGNSFVDFIANGITEITVPGEHYRRGMLLLGGGYTPGSAQDNLYTYAPGGSGRFVVHSRDLPSEPLQNAQHSYVYINFDRPIEMP